MKHFELNIPMAYVLRFDFDSISFNSLEIVFGLSDDTVDVD